MREIERSERDSTTCPPLPPSLSHWDIRSPPVQREGCPRDRAKGIRHPSHLDSLHEDCKCVTPPRRRPGLVEETTVVGKSGRVVEVVL